MIQPSRKKLVLLGMMSKLPVAGVVWQTMHYLVGFERLGYDVYYVEAHARAPSMLMMDDFDGLGMSVPDLGTDRDAVPRDDLEYGSARAASFIAEMMRRFGLGDRWAFVALHGDGRSYGLSETQLAGLYDSAAVLINLHGGTEPLPELTESGRLVLLETDPVRLQVELYENVEWSIDFLEQHRAHFTFAENYGNPDCLLPVSNRFDFRPTRQPVILDFWEGQASAEPDTFTTIGNWRQPLRDIMFGEETYGWSKHQEFLKFLDVPTRTQQSFELALASYEEGDQRMLESKGWRVRDALGLSTSIDAYRDYIVGSRGEFTAAKDQNVRFRSGWFSDRSATYLASGRPVISQETGFSNVLPAGEGLFGFTTLDEIAEAVESIRSDYRRHCKAASELAREYFSHDVVLRRLLEDLGETLPGGRATKRPPEGDPLPSSLALVPVSRRPTELSQETVETVLERPIPAVEPSPSLEPPLASIVVVTYDNLVFTRLCLESVLANTEAGTYELIVVDNASRDRTPDYLRQLAGQNPDIEVVLNGRNVGFPRACNQGLALSRGKALVLLNNDAIVPPGWLEPLIATLQDETVGLVGPTTNRMGNEAEVETSYRTYGEFIAFARERANRYREETFDIPSLTMFCLAMRRDLYEQVGPLDERFEVGMLEDDDYSLRVRAAGYRVVCADDVFVHHFGETSFGKLVPTGEYATVLAANRARFEQKWGRPWKPYARRSKPEYESTLARIRQIVRDVLPPQATVLVVSRGDEELLKLNGCQARHFPEDENGLYAGHHPTDSAEAIAHIEAARESGGEFLLFPRTGLWWLEHYEGLRAYLDQQYETVVRQEDTCIIFALDRPER